MIKVSCPCTVVFFALSVSVNDQQETRRNPYVLFAFVLNPPRNSDNTKINSPFQVPTLNLLTRASQLVSALFSSLSVSHL